MASWQMNLEDEGITPDTIVLDLPRSRISSKALQEIIQLGAKITRYLLQPQMLGRRLDNIETRRGPYARGKDIFPTNQSYGKGG